MIINWIAERINNPERYTVFVLPFNDKTMPSVHIKTKTGISGSRNLSYLLGESKKRKNGMIKK